MTSDQLAAEARRERDAQMLADIIALRESEPFNRYWLPRVRRKRGEIEVEFRTGAPAAVDKDRREELRQQLLLIDELLAMMDKDDGNIRGGMAKRP